LGEHHNLGGEGGGAQTSFKGGEFGKTCNKNTRIGDKWGGTGRKQVPSLETTLKREAFLKIGSGRKSYPIAKRKMDFHQKKFNT